MIVLHAVGLAIKMVKVNICYSAPSSLNHRRGTQVHGAHQAFSHIPALNLPSRTHLPTI